VSCRNFPLSIVVPLFASVGIVETQSESQRADLQVLDHVTPGKDVLGLHGPAPRAPVA